VPAKSRRTLNIATDGVADRWDVSTMLDSDQPVIAERAMYWNGKQGGHDAHGQRHPNFESYLAEGCTAGGFETWVLLQNPGEEDVTAYVTYQTAEGAVEREPLLLEAGSRFSINVGLDVGETWEVSTLVRSTAAIVVEHAVYWNGKTEGTCSTGFAKM
ncbi:MAG: hypothetical protein HPY75_14865, partial [Actinobacteria bacterium]|nr:hypothetical protein [Actinomycetota bacterium]